MIDASHANSSKKPENQPLVLADVGTQIAAGDRRIIGIMAESHLVAGRQDLKPGVALTYGQSITDGCIGWDDTVVALERLAEAVEQRRRAPAEARRLTVSRRLPIPLAGASRGRGGPREGGWRGQPRAPALACHHRASLRRRAALSLSLREPTPASACTEGGRPTPDSTP